MSWLQRVTNVFRGRALNADIDEELQFHIDARIEENLAAGMTEADARRDAFARFGSRAGARERTRDANLVMFVERAWQDLRHGARMFARNPALTAICIVSMAFGTGANVAMFSMVDTLLLRPLTVPRPARIVTVGSRVQRGAWARTVESYPNVLDIRDRARSFEALAAYAYETVAIATRPGDAPRVRFGAFVTNDFFAALGVVPQVGRGFLPDEDGKGRRGAVVVISDAFWRGSLAADPAVLQRKLQIAGREFAIVGVAPASFKGLEAYIPDSVYLPIGMLPHVATGLTHTWADGRPSADVLDARDARFLTIKARLRDGVSMSDARAELATIGRDLGRAYPDADADRPLVVETEFQYKYEARPLDSSLLVVLTVLSIGVLGVACANVAGLLTSRAPVRAREMSLRLAIGASRSRLIRQLVTECVLIATAGGIAGLAVGRVGLAVLRQMRFPTDIVSMPAFELDQRALVFSLLVAVSTALLVGLGPAVATTRVDLAGSLKASDRGSAGGRLTARSTLVAVQVALSLVLLTLTVFAVQVFHRVLDRGPGFRTTNMAKLTVDPGQAGYGQADAARFFARVLDDTRAVPGVRSAAIASAMPLGGFVFVPVLHEGERARSGEPLPLVWGSSVDEDFFRTIDSTLIAGRFFTAADDATAPRVVIVNEALARRYWPGLDPIGKRVQVLEGNGPLATIVGVVATTTLGYPGELPVNGVYFPYRQRPAAQMVLLASTWGESAALVAPLQDVVNRIDRDVPVFDAQTIEAFYGDRVTGFGTVMLRVVSAMGLMGMVLTMVGLYGLVSYSVRRRTRELGIRIAIGATYARIMTMVLRQGMRPALAGVVAGLGLSFVTARYMNQLVPFAHHVNAATYYVAVPLLVVVTLGAAFLPARRAALVNPTDALRCE